MMTRKNRTKACLTGFAILFSTFAWAQDGVDTTVSADPDTSVIEARKKQTEEDKKKKSQPPSPTVQALDFKYEPGTSKLKITFSSPVAVEKSVLDQDKQVVLEIKGAKIPKKYARKLDTSSFRSNVSIISPYQAKDDVRIVLQLKDNGSVDVTPNGKEIIATIDNREDGLNDVTADAALPAEPLAAQAPPAASGDEYAAGAAPADLPPEDSLPPVEATIQKDTLSQFFEAQTTKKYVGRRITLQLRDTEIHDVFRAVSEASEFNIVLGDDVKGRLTLNLTDVPWDQALDIVLQSQRLAAERNGNILRVTTMDTLTKEKQAEIVAKKAAEAAEPIVVKIFPVSYAKIDEMKKILEDFLSREFSMDSGFAAGAVLASTPQTTSSTKRGSIQIDTRTNSLVVRDTPSTIEKIKRILKELDMQTPQVLIEAKFVEVKESSTRDIQGRIFSTSREFDAQSNQLTFNSGKNNYGTLFGGSSFGTSQLPASFAISPIQGAAFGFSPRAGLIPGIGEIAALISILESEEQVKVIASPRIVTQNQQPAEISQGTTIQLPTIAGANAAGGFVTVNAVLKLTVTPQVTNDGNITMKINFSQESPSAQQLTVGSLSTDSKKVDTSVLVDSGSTLVIGGIYSSSINNAEAGIPILRDIPLIGPLFGSKSKKTQKGELFIFLTPRVINDKESGLRSS